MLGQQPQAGEHFAGVGDDPRVAVDHRAPVVDRVLEHRTGQHEPVRYGDRHARLAVRAQAHAGDGTVQVQGGLVEAVAGRHHHRPAVADHAEVGDQSGGEDGVQVAPFGPALLAEPAVPGALSTGQRAGHLQVISRPRECDWHSRMLWATVSASARRPSEWPGKSSSALSDTRANSLNLGIGA